MIEMEDCLNVPTGKKNESKKVVCMLDGNKVDDKNCNEKTKSDYK